MKLQLAKLYLTMIAKELQQKSAMNNFQQQEDALVEGHSCRKPAQYAFPTLLTPIPSVRNRSSSFARQLCWKTAF